MILIIFKQLYRNLTISSFPRCAFQTALECYTAQWTLFWKISRSHRYDQRTVCIFAVTRLITHSIDCQHSLFRGCVNHITARTHAE